MVCSQELETQKGKFNLEDNKLERHETIKRMKFDEHLTGGNMLYKEIKRRYHDDKGDINRKDGCQEREKVAFSAFLSRDLSNLGPGHTLQYGATHLNEGHAFNANTGVFTVPVDGVYLFAFACEDDHNRRIYADIFVDGKRASLVLSGPSGVAHTVVHSMGTNVVILRLIQSQSVWVAIDAGGHGNSLQNTATTFSGVFLYY